MPHRRLLSTLLAAALCGACATASAQSWPPEHPITVLVPFAPGASTDIAARALQPGLEAVWKQSVIVENKPGAGGMIGTADAAKSKPDGTTLLFHTNGALIAPLFQKDIPYDPASLRPIVGVASAYYVVVAAPNPPAKTFREFVGYAKDKTKQLNYATVSYAVSDLEIHSLLQLVGLSDMQPIYYNGAAALIQGTARGDVTIGWTSVSSALQLMKSGKLVPLATSAPQRTPDIPDVPTLREQGIDRVASYTYGLFVPVKTPQAIVDHIIDDVTVACKMPDTAKRLNALSFWEPDHKHFEQQMARENAEFGRVAKQIGLKPQ
jgi:tripartite-type tricarboxylate transporter receptor subunit TctC